MSVQEGKVFIGGLSWETTNDRLRRYFENYGAVKETFVSYDRMTGRPRGFGFVIFTDPIIADKVVALQHTIDRRQVEVKKALPKDESPISKDQQAVASGQPTKKIFVGGLAASVDEEAFRAYFEEFGTVEDAVVMYDHDNNRSRGFGFITFTEEEAVDNVYAKGAMHVLNDKQIEIKRAVPRDAMIPSPRMMYGTPPGYGARSPYGGGHRYHHGPPHGHRSYGTPSPHGFGRGRGGPDSHLYQYSHRSPQPIRGSPADHHHSTPHHHPHHLHHPHHAGPGMPHHPHHHLAHPHHHPHAPPHHGMYTPPPHGAPMMGGLTPPMMPPPAGASGGDPAGSPVVPVPASSLSGGPSGGGGDPAMQSPSQLVGGFSLQNGMAGSAGAAAAGVASPSFALDQQQQEPQQSQQQLEQQQGAGSISMASVSEALAEAATHLDQGEQQQNTLWS